MGNNKIQKLLVAGVVMTGLVAGSAFAADFGQMKFTNNSNYDSVQIGTTAGIYNVTSSGVASVNNNDPSFRVVIPATGEDLRCTAFTGAQFVTSNSLTLEIENQTNSAGSNVLQTYINAVNVPVQVPVICTGSMGAQK